MSDMILRRLAILENRVAYLEGINSPNRVDPSYMQHTLSDLVKDAERVFSGRGCTQPQAHPERCGCKHDHDIYLG